MADFKVGQTATNAKGVKVQFDGANWVRMAGTAPVPGGVKPDKTAAGFLNNLSTEAAAAQETGRLYDRAEADLRAIRPGPYRNSLLLSPAIPQDQGGILDRLGATIIGGPARMLGAITPKEVSSYQSVEAVQNAAVLERQLLQKGVQTNTDAARMMLADISPNKTIEANMKVMNAGRQVMQRKQAKAVFYTQFANKFGLNGTSPHGYTADQIWANMAPQLTKQILGQKNTQAAPTIKVISRTRVN